MSEHPSSMPDPQAPGPLHGIRVVECGHMVAAAYAGKLMADLGAEVIKVEEPSGDLARQRGPYPGNTPHPEKSGLFLYLNTNKCGVTLNLGTAKGQELFQRLVKDADVVVHNYHPTQIASLGLEYEALAQHNPKLVMTSISPFGQTGPHREYTAHDLTMWTAGGIAFLGGAGGRPDLPPLKAAGQQAGFQAGVNAGIASLGALYARLGTGRGQHIDISVQECLVAIMENNYIAWPYDQTTPSRLGFRLIPQDVLPCRDGYIYVLAVEEHQWQNAVELMGNPEWANTELFQDFLARSVNWDAPESVAGRLVAGQVGPRGLPRSAETARAFCAGFDHGRPAQIRTSQRAGLFCRDWASRSRFSSLSGVAVQICRLAVDPAQSGPVPGPAQ